MSETMNGAMNEGTKYIYLGKNIDLPEFGFIKGNVYYGDKIEELKKKYPLLDKLLINVEELSKYEKNELFLDKISQELKEEIEEKTGGSE
jgi:hypothetical protein|nr:MAG TPA: hypothetical protein [Caudoviricetes sp.]